MAMLPLGARKHPEYDFDMEVLLCIAPSPGYAIVKHMVEDFDLPDQKHIHAAVRRLQDEFGGIITLNVPGAAGEASGPGRGIAVERRNWDAVKAACQSYWNKVQGSPVIG